MVLWTFISAYGHEKPGGGGGGGGGALVRASGHDVWLDGE